MCYHAIKGVGINTGEPQNCGALEFRCLGMGRVTDSKIHAPPHVCYHTATKGVRINRTEPQNWGGLRPHPLGVGAWLTT